MTNNAIKIHKKDRVRGEDGYKTFSIRIKEETVRALDKLAEQSNRSRNELICLILEQSVGNIEIIE
jgi:predicted DNA-binding protein